ncbi:MAG: ABC transporter ATP-binding protein [Thalassobaculaceae bacterium]|nr:ABC transporter ATP-binding protein [Thalassobaculaceae bacterium]
MAEIVVRNLRKEFGDFTAVQSSSFKIEDGEFFMLLGPSGCGKTTTLRMLAGLELPTSGEIYIDGEEVSQKPASQRDIAFVFQMFALYPHMNVRKNLSYPLVSQGLPKNQIHEKVAEVSRILGIENILDAPVSGLSGGDRQRVALGRAIVRNPKCFLMDEPLGALDAEFRERMADELRGLHDRMGATTVYVTHDQLEAMQMGDKIVVMNHGVIEQFGTPRDIYDKPTSMFVADFIGSPPMNFLKVRGSLEVGATSIEMHHQTFGIPTLTEPFSGDMIYGVRPEHIRLSDVAPYRAEIVAAEYLGTTQIVTLRTYNGEVKARVSSADTARVGENVGLDFDGATVTLFDSQTGRAIRSELNAGVLGHG